MKKPGRIMATTLTKKGWFGKTSGAWSKTGSNTVVDTVDGIKLNAPILNQVLPNVSLNQISTGDGYLTLTGDASKNINLKSNFDYLWNNKGILIRGALVVGNGGCNIIGTGGTGIESDNMMFLGTAITPSLVMEASVQAIHFHNMQQY